MALIAIVAMGLLYSSHGPAQPIAGNQHTPSFNAKLDLEYSQEPKTLGDLLALTEKQLAEVDIARMNLLCAEVLPGSETIQMDEQLRMIDGWARRVFAETNRHLYKFRQNPGEFQNSEAFFRMLMLVTVLQQDCGVKYNLDRARVIDFTRSPDLFLHGMVPGKDQSLESMSGGTCVSMPVLYAAIGRRLGYPIKLVTTKAHVFCRWDTPKEQFNIEATNQGMNSFDDEYYKRFPAEITEAEVKKQGHLKSLTPGEELAMFLATRGHCLLDIGIPGMALGSYESAQRYAPHVALYKDFIADASRKRAIMMFEVANDPRIPPPDALTQGRQGPPSLRFDSHREVERINAYNKAMLAKQFENFPKPPIPQARKPFGALP